MGIDMFEMQSHVQSIRPQVHGPYKDRIIKMKFRKSKQVKVATNTWNDPKFRQLSAPNPNGQTLWWRLTVSPERDRIPGLISITLEQLAHSLGWGVEETRRCWKEIEDIGWGVADWDAGLVWLPTLIFQNSPNNPNMIKGWWRHFDELPKCGLLYQAWWKIGELLALRGGKWHEAFQEASDIIFEGAYSGDEFADIHACFGNRILDFSKFREQKPPPPQAPPPPKPTPPAEEQPPASESPPEEDPGPCAAKNQELFPQEQGPPPTKKKSTHKDASFNKDYAKVAKALDEADKIAWEGSKRIHIPRQKLGTNQKKHIEKVLREGYSVDDLVKVILRKGEDAYRVPFYTDRDGNEQSNRALVTLEHVTRPGKMDYYLRRDELDNHKKPKKKNTNTRPITLEEYNEAMAARPTTSNMKHSLPKYTEEEAFELARSVMLGR